MTEDIETLSLKQPESMGPIRCDLDDAQPVVVDKEWMGPGKWKHHLECPTCGRTGTMNVETGFVHKDQDGWIDHLKQTFSESEAMSVEALERSMNRLLGLGD